MFFFVGPVLLILTTIFEWIMGNFFPMMVCGLFAVFWLSFGMLQLPTLGLAAPYSTDGTDAIAGSASKSYNAVIALYLLVWGFALFTFWIFTLKTNTVFALIFLFVTLGAWVLSGAYWKVSTGDYDQAAKLQKVGFPYLHIRSRFPQLCFLFSLTKPFPIEGRWSVVVHSRVSRLVHDVRDDGRRDALGHPTSRGRSQPLLAPNRFGNGQG